MKRLALHTAFWAVCFGGCGSDTKSNFDSGTVDAAAIDAAIADAMPQPDADIYPATLKDTGLYSNFAGRVLAEGVFEYTPAYPLWSDGAAKRRWVYLPPGTKIDTTDMDFWVYPQGTKLWKEFRDGDTLLETRLIWKMGASSGSWYYVSYAWNQEQTEAVAVPLGVKDTLGTTFDIPDDRDCRKCHERQPDFVLGFSAIQLAHQNPGVNLDTLIAGAQLTSDPAGDSPYYPVPGVGAEQAMLGYFHGNCGGCHHRDSDVMDTAPGLNLRLEVDSIATPEETTSYTTSVGIDNVLSLPGVEKLIKPGDTDASAIYVRMNQRGFIGVSPQMPELGSEVIDSEAMATLTQWIGELPQ